MSEKKGTMFYYWAFQSIGLIVGYASSSIDMPFWFVLIFMVILNPLSFEIFIENEN